MSADGYALLRSSTVAYLLECYRLLGEDSRPELTEEVVRDLRGAVSAGLPAPAPAGERLRALGPILTVEQHLDLLESDTTLELPRDRSAGAFWRLVARVVHAMQSNEAEAVLRLLGEEGSNER